MVYWVCSGENDTSSENLILGQNLLIGDYLSNPTKRRMKLNPNVHPLDLWTETSQTSRDMFTHHFRSEKEGDCRAV